MRKGVTPSAWNEVQKHVAASMHNLGLTAFAGGVVSNIVASKGSIEWPVVGFFLILWFATYWGSTYILSRNLIFPEEDGLR